MTNPAILSPTAANISQACTTYNLTSAQFSSLQTLSTNAKSTAYCPYSRFRVGATILTENDHCISGANVENASYPVGTCAERVMLGKAVTEGWKTGFRALAVATDSETPASPCGMCRQFIREFCDLSMPILMFDKGGNFVIMRLEQLLPLSFGPESLPSPEQLEAARARD